MTPWEILETAFLAGLGWRLGTSLMESLAAQANAWILARRARKASEESLARLKEGARELEKAAVAAEAAQANLRREAATAKPREAFFVMPETVGRS